MVLRVVVIILASYFLGNLNGAILISRLLAHDDVRRHGSGNAGFTNFCRNYGSLSGLLVSPLMPSRPWLPACWGGCCWHRWAAD